MIFVIRNSKELRHSQYLYKTSIAVADIICGFTISYIFLQHFYFIFNNNIHLPKVTEFNLTIDNKSFSNFTIYNYKIEKAALQLTSFNYDSTFRNIMKYFKMLFMPITVFVSIISLVFSAADRYCVL